MKSLRNVGGLALIVMVLTMAPAGAYAAPPVAHRAWLRADSPAQASVSGGSSSSAVSKSLALVVLLAGTGYFVWRKVNRKVTPTLSSRPHVRVLSGTVVGPKARAVVVEVGGRLILLGVTEQSVRRLAWLDTLEDNDRAQDTPGSEPRELEDISKRPTTNRSRPSSNTQATQRNELRAPRFSDVLRDAVGMKPKDVVPPAVALAAATHDRLTLRAVKEDMPMPAELVNVEGQAAGLVARLNRKQQ